MLFNDFWQHDIVGWRLKGTSLLFFDIYLVLSTHVKLFVHSLMLSTLSFLGVIPPGCFHPTWLQMAKEPKDMKVL